MNTPFLIFNSRLSSIGGRRPALLLALSLLAPACDGGDGLAASSGADGTDDASACADLDDEVGADDHGDDPDDPDYDPSDAAEDGPGLAELEVEGFDDIEGETAETITGSIRFRTSAGNDGEIRLQRGSIARVEYRFDGQVLASVQVDMTTAVPGVDSGACQMGFSEESISQYIAPSEQLEAAQDAGIWELYDDAVFEAASVSPGLAAMLDLELAPQTDNQTYELPCEDLCEMGGFGLGAGWGAGLGAALGGGPPGMIVGGMAGIVVGKNLAMACIEQMC